MTTSACGSMAFIYFNLFLCCNWEHVFCQLYNKFPNSWKQCLWCIAHILLVYFYSCVCIVSGNLCTPGLPRGIFLCLYLSKYTFYFSNWYLSFYLTKLDDVFSKLVVYMNLKIVVHSFILCCFYKNICKFKFVNLKLYS